MRRLPKKGPEDCEDSEFSAEIEEELVLQIEGVKGIYRDGFGAPYDHSAENPVVVVDREYKGKELGLKIEGEIERILGSKVQIEYE